MTRKPPRKGRASLPEPGRGNSYDKTRKLTLSVEERTAGYEIVDCINCEKGERRRMATCKLCRGMGEIKVLGSKEDLFDQRGKGGRPRKNPAA